MKPGRSTTPRVARSAASYSARMSSVYWAVKDRLLDWPERGLIASFSTDVLGRSAVVSVNVIKPVLAPCGRDEVLPEVSHISLTHRAVASVVGLSRGGCLAQDCDGDR